MLLIGSPGYLAVEVDGSRTICEGYLNARKIALGLIDDLIVLCRRMSKLRLVIHDQNPDAEGEAELLEAASRVFRRKTNVSVTPLTVITCLLGNRYPLIQGIPACRLSSTKRRVCRNTSFESLVT